eukprot:UC1_evm1s59
MSGRAIEAVSEGIPASYVADISRPQLSSAKIDLSQGKLFVDFTEIVDFRGMTIGLASLKSSSATVTLDGTVTSQFGLQMELTLTTAVVEKLKVARVCYVNSCTLEAGSGLVIDMVKLPLADSSIAVAISVQDTTAPNVIEFPELDLRTGVLTIKTDEPIDLGSVAAPSIYLQNFVNNADAKVELSTDKAVSCVNNDCTANPNSIVLTLTKSALDKVKLNQLVCVLRNNCYLSVKASAMRDVSSNNVVATFSGSTFITAGVIVADDIPPELSPGAFAVDLTQRQILLGFTEPVHIGSFQPLSITIKSAEIGTVSDTFYTLQGVNTVSVANGNSIIVQFSVDDLHALLSRDICTSSSSCYISLSNGAISDMTGVASREVPMTGASPVFSLVVDATRPTLDSFALDMDAGELTLVFSKPVRTSTLNVDKIALVSTSNAAPGTTTVHLTKPTTVDGGSLPGATTLKLSLNRPDLVDIKIQTGLARDTSNTFLTIEESSVQGMDNTDIVGIVSGSALDVGTGFTPDSTLVKITKFELDLNGAVVKLEFNDVVKASSFIGKPL